MLTSFNEEMLLIFNFLQWVTLTEVVFFIFNERLNFSSGNLVTYFRFYKIIAGCTIQPLIIHLDSVKSFIVDVIMKMKPHVHMYEENGM